MAKKRQEFYHKLRSKYRLVVMRDSTFEEVWFMRLSRLNVITVISSSVILISALVIALIVYTPLKVMIPGYPAALLRKERFVGVDFRVRVMGGKSGLKVSLWLIPSDWVNMPGKIS